MCFHQTAVNKKTNKQTTPFTEYKIRQNCLQNQTKSIPLSREFSRFAGSETLPVKNSYLFKSLGLMSVVSFPSTQNMAYKHTLGRTREADFIKPEAFLSPWMCCPAHPPRAYLALKWLPCWSKDLIGSTHCFSLWRDPGKRQQLWLELWMLIRNTGRTAMPSSGHPGVLLPKTASSSLCTALARQKPENAFCRSRVWKLARVKANQGSNLNTLPRHSLPS